MRQRELERLLDDLWEKYGHPDKHGYKDWMASDQFKAAARELLQIVKGKQRAKPRR